MKNRPSYYLDEKQLNNLYKHVRKKMKRVDCIKRMRKFLKDMSPLLVTVLLCTALFYTMMVAVLWLLA